MAHTQSKKKIVSITPSGKNGAFTVKSKVTKKSKGKTASVKTKTVYKRKK